MSRFAALVEVYSIFGEVMKVRRCRSMGNYLVSIVDRSVRPNEGYQQLIEMKNIYAHIDTTDICSEAGVC